MQISKYIININKLYIINIKLIIIKVLSLCDYYIYKMLYNITDQFET